MASAFSRFKNAVHSMAAGVFSQKSSGQATAVTAGYSGIEDGFETLGPVAVKRDGSRAGVGMSRGIVPAARLVMSAQPTANDTIGIGATTFIFVAALGAPTANVQVLIGGTAAATQASLVKAINGTSAPAEWTEATTPFAGLVVADAVSTSVRIRYATARGGTAVAGSSGSIALAEAITAAADVWNAANLNVAGKTEFGQAMVTYRLTLTALMLTAAGYAVELPFTPTQLVWSVLDSTGAPKSGTAITDTLTISGNAILFAQAGATHAVAGDVICFTATE